MPDETPDSSATRGRIKRTGPPCPHCGAKLREEKDLGDHLHCDSPLCNDCCFEPGNDGPVLREGYLPH